MHTEQVYTEARILAEIEACQDASQRTLLILLLHTQRSLEINTQCTQDVRESVAQLDKELREPLAIYTTLKSSLVAFDRAVVLGSKLFSLSVKFTALVIAGVSSFVGIGHLIGGNATQAKELFRLIISILTGRP